MRTCSRSFKKSQWRILIIVICFLMGIHYLRLYPFSNDTEQESPPSYTEDIGERGRSQDNSSIEQGNDVSIYEEEGHITQKKTQDMDAFEHWKLTMEDRKQRVKEVCSKHGKNLTRDINLTSRREGLLYDLKHNLAYCQNAKSGSTTWISDLLQDAGFSEKAIAKMGYLMAHYNAEIKVFPPLPYEKAVEQMNHPDQLQFTVVRHPFIRLVSAYRQKILKERLPKLAPLYPKIIEKYRDGKDYRNQSQGQAKPSFRELTLFMADSILACPELDRKYFGKIDVHWRPIYFRCAPCNIRYDVISKMETFNEDRKYIRQLAGLPPKTSSVFSNKNKKGPSDDLGQIKAYFSQLSDAEKQKIYKAYFYDFELFGYSPDIAEAEDIQSLLL